MPNRRRSTRRAEELSALNESISNTPAPSSSPSAFDMQHLLQTLTSAVSAAQPTIATKPFKTPQYSGKGDIDLFISQFKEVTAANRWSDPEAKLHLKLNLSGPAASCSDGNTTADILDNLQARFGLSTRQAKEKLRAIKRTNNQDLHELGTEITRLTKLAYPTLSQHDQVDMALDVFTQAIDNLGLQRHFLATQPTSLKQAITSAEEFFQLSKDSRQPRLNVISEKESTATKIDQLISRQNSLQQQLIGQQQQILQQLQQIRMTPPPITPPPFYPQSFPPQRPAAPNPQAPVFTPRPINRPPLACYECQGPHLKRNCPKLQNKTTQPPENYQGPAQ